MMFPCQQERPQCTPLRDGKPTSRQLGYFAFLYHRLADHGPPPDVHTRAGASAAIEAAKRKLASKLPPVIEPDATPEQLHDIAVLARRLGRTAPEPRDRGHASVILARLRKESQPKRP